MADLSSGGMARRLTEEPGMLGLFATRFRVHWEGGGKRVYPHFDQARRAVHPTKGRPVKIERIETIWLHKSWLRETEEAP